VSRLETGKTYQFRVVVPNSKAPLESSKAVCIHCHSNVSSRLFTLQYLLTHFAGDLLLEAAAAPGPAMTPQTGWFWTSLCFASAASVFLVLQMRVLFCFVFVQMTPSALIDWPHK
jgi:hypothetical protein